VTPIQSVEELSHRTTVYIKKRVFRGYPATEWQTSEVVVRIHQIQTKIFDITQFNNHGRAVVKVYSIPGEVETEMEMDRLRTGEMK
jgi:expansin (peptidoglycan-binding protein)